MGEIKTSVKEEGFYYSDNGYVVPVKPKTRSVYDYESRKHRTLPDYTLEQFVFAENKFNHIREVLNSEYGGEFVIEQTSDRNRIASVVPLSLFELTPEKSLWGWNSWVDLSFFTLSLQHGLTYNFPGQKLSQVFKIDFKMDAEIYKGGGNKGFIVEDTLKYMKTLKEYIGEVFASQNAVMTDAGFAQIVAMFKMHSSGIIMYDLNEWVRYVIAEADLNLTAYGFSRRLFSGKGINFIPVEQVKEYHGLPFEWVERILAEK